MRAGRGALVLGALAVLLGAAGCRPEVVLGTAITLVSGRALTRSGRRHRALWGAFRRYIHHHGRLDGVGPGGIVVWGPYLAYGVVLGEADDAARVLTP